VESVISAHVLEAVLFTIALAWLGIGGLLYWNYLGTPRLSASEPAPPLPRAPRVSIIVAARNEEDALPAALESFLALDYPNYEVILVDDDSTDRTGAIADEWAARRECAGKLRVIHNHDLPAGWRGKVRALHLAEQAATGDWILATDADVILDPTLLRRAMALAEQRNAQLLSLTPEFEMNSFAEKVVLPAFSILLATLYPPRLVNNPASRRAIAAGAFILMRRAELDALGGYESLKNTVIEDLRMAELFKHSGRRIGLAITRGLFRTRMYRGWREMFEGLSRSAFEGTGFSLPMVLAGVAVGNAMAVLPWLAALWSVIRAAWQGGLPLHDPVFLVALAACAACILTYSSVITYLHISFVYAFMIPLAALFYSCVAVNSALATLCGPGVTWKGRNYRKPR
jgi:chlorobactene glucosyltransferase